MFDGFASSDELAGVGMEVSPPLLMGGADHSNHHASAPTPTPSGKESSSVALEHKDIAFVVPHTEENVAPLDLSFLGRFILSFACGARIVLNISLSRVVGTIAFYLDPEAKIFKIEVLNTLEGAENTVKHAGKRARKSGV